MAGYWQSTFFGGVMPDMCPGIIRTLQHPDILECTHAPQRKARQREGRDVGLCGGCRPTPRV